MAAAEGELEGEGCCSLVYVLVGVASVLWLIRKIVYSTQSRWFSWVMHFCTKDVFPELEEVKKEHFASMSSIVSHDPALLDKKAIRILEIGVGTGVNFAHYPEGSHLVVVDPNPHFKSYFEENRKSFPHLQVEDFVVTTGDRMEAVKDESVDVVVVTLVLCSLPSETIQATLKEIQRVLVPGGKFYFMEHIVEFDLKKYWWRRKLQHVFTHWIPVWPFIFDGCCLDRDTLPVIQQAGFSSVHAQKYYAPIPSMFYEPERSNMKGIATK
ncbi:methyltransferase-like protein 7A isoform X2 [Portunus trituberculatus]|nr:methyltransferase-like protein 7A isoform X2 [Portunus trituberculatus]XP_045116455.1 methyltransferase-like protein 7A isoform X2 [Portunus trituberculatus]XP_045116456.1 methyltransferase-like protein 7A isoform X2 [Portunus trituberculatus]XP_045116458.1 methyltransferase-like protein 7A isoform X2 [Portunus trituberculatus]